MAIEISVDKNEFQQGSETCINLKKVNGKFNCNKCDKPYGKMAHLNHHHQVVHEGFSYACQKCGKLFTQRYNLDLHIRHVHNGLKLSCDMSIKSFSKKKYFINHINMYHTFQKRQEDK